MLWIKANVSETEAEEARQKYSVWTTSDAEAVERISIQNLSRGKSLVYDGAPRLVYCPLAASGKISRNQRKLFKLSTAQVCHRQSLHYDHAGICQILEQSRL